MSPSANHLLALINCTTFSHCLNSMIGDDMMAIAQGNVLSILFARASSIAHALPGLASSAAAGFIGLPGCAEAGEPLLERSEGERMGEEKERR